MSIEVTDERGENAAFAAWGGVKGQYVQVGSCEDRAVQRGQRIKLGKGCLWAARRERRRRRKTGRD